MVLPHLDLPIINPLIPWGSSGWLQRLLRFSFQARIFTSILYLSLFKFFSYIKMYCLKYWRVRETENITTATSRNGRLMRRGQCITCGKTKTQFVKIMLPVEVFLISWWTNSLSKCIYQDTTLLALEQNSINDWMRMERQRSGVYL